MAALRAESEALPPIALHIHFSAAEAGEATFCSVLRQMHRRWTLYVTAAGWPDSNRGLPDDPRIQVLDGSYASRAEGLTQVLEIAQTSHVVPLFCGATLTPGALIAFARAVAPGAVIYADQDENGVQERDNPWLKPEWDADLFLAQDYLSDACALPVDAARTAGIDPNWPDETVVYALLARLLVGPSPAPAVHVPFIAVTTPAGHWRRECPSRAALVSAFIGLPVRAGPFGTLHLARPHPSPPPRVSVIVPTRDKVDLLRTCLSGVLHGTDYPAIELIIVDNDSVEPQTLAFFAEMECDPRVKVVHWPHAYNYSAINNFAVGEASGPYLCLLNNDTEVIDPTWLSALMAHAVRPETGAVGAKLLYPDRTIQHAGVVVGLGNAAGHAHRGLAEDAPGYFAQSHLTRAATAVTAACLVVAKDKFKAVGGLDEQSLGVAYNDVDFCLKLRAAGWRNLYVPQAVMIHHESKSRDADLAPGQLARYMRELAVLQERWGTVGFVDPTHHVALDPASEEYRLRF
jgi:GT2 family glycosyltransferase